MAGFFGFFDFTKPGPGVPKDGPQKARILVFFEIFTRKFWSLLKLNLLFFLFNIPAVLAMLFVVPQFYLTSTFSDDVLIDLVIKFAFGAVFVCIPLITVGPAQAGFTYVLRNYAREEHAFIWWDFKENALKNLKQSLIISVIDLIVFIIIVIDLNIYMTITKNSNNFLLTVASAFLILAFIIYLIMHMYIYPMMVTFSLSIKQIYKNALIFSIINFIPNVFILLICTVLVGISFLIYPVIGIMMFPIITLSLIGFITNFFVYPRLKKHMIDKIQANDEQHVQQ